MVSTINLVHDTFEKHSPGLYNVYQINASKTNLQNMKQQINNINVVNIQ